ILAYIIRMKIVPTEFEAVIAASPGDRIGELLPFLVGKLWTGKECWGAQIKCIEAEKHIWRHTERIRVCSRIGKVRLLVRSRLLRKFEFEVTSVLVASLIGNCVGDESA